jgi:hypothetical protein
MKIDCIFGIPKFLYVFDDNGFKRTPTTRANSGLKTAIY